MKVLMLLMMAAITSCVTPVTKQQWEVCDHICSFYGGIKEVCVERSKGLGCHCDNDLIVWPEQKELKYGYFTPYPGE